MTRASIVFLAVLLAAGAAPAQDVLLNEFMAISDATLMDEDGEYSDWIEIYNSGTSDVDLAGWYLTDNSNDLTRWAFPATNLAAGAYLIVFASEKDRAEESEYLHTDFKLGGAGEYLALVLPDGTSVVSAFSPAYPPQYANVSYGFGAEPSTSVWLDAGAACRAFVPPDDALGSNWIERTGFDDSGWLSGTTGVGYDLYPDYVPLIGLDVSNEMYLVHPTVYMRLPFVVDDASGFAGLLLKMKYDDGFFAYLNGTEIARRYAPETPAWNAEAPDYHPDEEALVYESLSIADGEDLLVTGTNLLALLALNHGTGSSDLLFVPWLAGLRERAVPTGQERFFTVPTPGAENGVGVDDLGPVIRSPGHAPHAPAAAENLLVTALVEEASAAVTSVWLRYRVMYSNEVELAMVDDGAGDDGVPSNGVWGATVPASAFTTGQMVRYCLLAADTAGRTSRWPLAEDPAAYLGTVVQDPALTNPLPVFHWFVEDPDWHREPWGNNKDFEPASVYCDGAFYDGVQVRVRGQTASGWTNPPFKFEFPKGHYFVFATNQPPAEEININSVHSDKSFLRMILSYETYREAGVPFPLSFPVRAQKNGAFYSVAAFVGQVDERFLAFEGLNDEGAMYKMYQEMTSSTVRVEKRLRKDESNDDLQALVDGVSLTNSAAARTTFAFDHIDIPSVVNYLVATVLLHDRDKFYKNYYAHRDTDASGEWMYLAWDMDLTLGRNWTNTIEGVLNDNITFTDPPIIPESWANRVPRALLDGPRTMAMYSRRLRSVMDLALQAPGTAASNRFLETRIAYWVPRLEPDVALHRAKWGTPYGVDQTFTQAVAILTNEYLLPRRYHLYVTNHVDRGGIVPDAQTNSPVLYFGNIDFKPASSNQDEEYIQFVNPHGVDVDVSGWSLSNAVRYTFKPGTVIEAGGSLYVSPDAAAFRARAVSPKGGEGRFVQGPYDGHLSAWGEMIELYDATGGLVNATAYAGDPSDAQRYLRITEIMYDPRDPPGGSPYEDGHFEYIEFLNISSNVLDLSGVRFSSGLTFGFTNGATTLGPGRYLVLVRCREAFATRYDTNGLVLAGDYGGRLSNNGEWLKVEDPSNETILEFRYSDLWYTNTDGGGYSLTIRDAYGDHETWGDSNRWRSSAVYDGSPGWDDSDLVDEDGDMLPDTWENLWFGGTNVTAGGPEEDFDGDGTPDKGEYLAGTEPTNRWSDFVVEIGGEAGGVLVSYASCAATGTGYATKQRYYTLESATQTVEGAWAGVAGYTNRPGGEGPVAYTNQGDAPARAFRVRAWLENGE